MDITNIFWRSLGVISHAKTFVTDCRFRTDLVPVWTARGIRSKKIVIRSNDLGYPFEKSCHPFERLGISVWKNCYPFERLGLSIRKKNLSTVRATEAICSKRATRVDRSVILQVTYVTILGDPGAVSRVGRNGGMKVFKYGQKSPWVPTLTELFPKIQVDAGSWLGTKNALYYCAQLANSFSWVLFVTRTRRLLSRSRFVWFMHQRNARSPETFSLIKNTHLISKYCLPEN